MGIEDGTFTLDELAEQSGIEPRTIRSYVAKGLIPKPSRGRGAKYDSPTLNRILTIKHLMAETGCTLDYCRRILSSMDDETVSRIARGDENTVERYMLRSVSQRDAVEISVSESQYVANAVYETLEHDLSTADQKKQLSRSRFTDSETWVVVRITDDMFLHVREDADDVTISKVDEVVQAAKSLVIRSSG